MSQTYQLNDLTDSDYLKIATNLKNGDIAVMPSDTIYGIFTSAQSPQSVKKVYELKKRDKNKAFIILISQISDLNKFNIQLPGLTKKFLNTHWPSPLTIILDCPSSSYHYLHHGLNTLAFRIPKNIFLLKLLKLSGPLIAPSANFSDQPPAINITAAKKYFQEKINFYIDAGTITGLPSTIIKFTGHKPQIIRQGAYKLS